MAREALVDGDVILYAGGFASDAAAKHNGEEHEPLEYCLHGVKRKLHAILDAAGADSYRVFISHPINYREELFPDYKQNRDILHKPFWYDEIREYLLEHHGAEYSQPGDEADDAMGISQMEALAEDRETIICSIDKDLDMIPGLHYNFSKTRAEEGVYEAEDPECLRIFYTQILTGDGTDNIPGMKKILGTPATQKYKAPLLNMSNTRDMYHYVLDIYQGDKAQVELLGKLLWIKRTNHWWEAPV